MTSDNNSVGKDIVGGVKEISAEEWNKAMEKAEKSERDRTRWMAERMQKQREKKK